MMQASTGNQFKNLCHNIVWLRRSHGLSRKKMSALLGIGLWSLTQLERGQIPPRLSIELIFEISRTFHIPPYRLFASRLDESWDLPETEKPVIPTERM